MSSFGDGALVLIKTKLHRPRLGRDLIPRPHLIDRLNQCAECKLTLISAQAGAGKSTLLVQWLEECAQPSAWLSLDRHDNDLTVFVSYLCAAIQTVFPEACEHTLDLLSAPFTPPPRIITTSLVNELDALFRRDNSSAKGDRLSTGLIVVLDDYQNITEPTIHELISELITYLPQGAHLALASRRDPPLPLAGLRASNEMSELRSGELRLTKEEAGELLKLATGRDLSSDTIDLLENKTDGWAVGLRLAALSIHEFTDDEKFAERLTGTTSSSIVDYLVSEVLSRLSPIHHDFLLRTSILERFNAEICAAIFLEVDAAKSTTVHRDALQSQRFLEELNAANLFLIPLNEEGQWFRYHQLFRDLLRHRLRLQYSPEEITSLHNRASRWFENNALIEEALDHAFTAGNLERAAQVVSGQRYTLMNQAQWQRLDRYLRRFPFEFVNQSPDLLILKTWLIYHQGHWGQLPAALGQLSTVMDETALPTKAIRLLKGEISVLRSLVFYFQTNAEGAISEAESSIKNTAPELWIVRILARVFLAGAHQIRGELNHAYEEYYKGLDEEDVQSNRFKATLLMTSCNLHWIAADLQRMESSAAKCIALCDFHHSAEIKGYGNYHLGRVHYQRNDLAAAEKHFDLVVQQPYLNYGHSFADSAFCLGLIYQAQKRSDEAREIAALAVAHMLETSNTTLLPVALAFQAEIALRQGQIAVADQWASQFESIPPIMPMIGLNEPHFTLTKIWLAHDTPTSRQQADELLDRLRNFTELTNNTVCLIQVLALQAILRAAEDDEPAALNLLEKSLILAQPGGFIRLFVDLGPPIAHLLHALSMQGVAPDYTSRILAAYQGATIAREQLTISNQQHASAMVDSLTPRELEVLELLARRLTNKEIAGKLVVSPGTVKTHTLSIYAKLDVHSRRQAVEKAQELNLLPQT